MTHSPDQFLSGVKLCVLATLLDKFHSEVKVSRHDLLNSKFILYISTRHNNLEFILDKEPFWDLLPDLPDFGQLNPSVLDPYEQAETLVQALC